ncbi:MAG: FkbM family methyltransferase [Actinobacteria bacterium]|nr:FkbM family methyltransferase [Actinomycetota bacterium]
MTADTQTESGVDKLAEMRGTIRDRLAVPVGHRMLGGWLGAPLRAENYATLGNLLRSSPDAGPLLARYLTGSGAYPYAARVRTPIGEQKVHLSHSHDVVTLFEVFFRRDYAAARDISVAVDIGANIGVSALYFLTRNAQARCYCFEPHPENAAKLRANLAGLGGRYVLNEEAIAERAGTVSFGIEPTGRYGSIGAQTGSSISVECRDVNSALAEVLEAEGSIDVLKIDTEGLEAATIAAIRPELLERIGLVYFEAMERPAALHEGLFRRTRRRTVERLERRKGVGAEGE